MRNCRLQTQQDLPLQHRLQAQLMEFDALEALSLALVRMKKNPRLQHASLVVFRPLHQEESEHRPLHHLALVSLQDLQKLPQPTSKKKSTNIQGAKADQKNTKRPLNFAEAHLVVTTKSLQIFKAQPNEKCRV